MTFEILSNQILATSLSLLNVGHFVVNCATGMGTVLFTKRKLTDALPFFKTVKTKDGTDPHTTWTCEKTWKKLCDVLPIG